MRAFFLAAAAAFAQAPDLIIHNAKILTVNANFETAQAMAIRADRIIGTGTNAAMLALSGPVTRKLDLGGRTVLPGLIDSHSHATDAAMWEFDHDVPDMETIADVLRYIGARAKAVPEGQWILVSQVFITRLREQRFPTRAELDKAAPRHPVYFRTGPDASLNSLAMKLSGIAKGFKVTDGKPALIETDPSTGEPTGIVRSGARLIPYKSSGRQATALDRANRFKALAADYNAVGLTSICDRDTDDDSVALYRALRDKGELSVRVFINLSVDAQAPLPDVFNRLDNAARGPLHKYNNMVWLRGIKMYMDGGMLTGSAYMRQPWGVSKVYSITDPNYRGMRYIEAEKLYQVVRHAMRVGLQPTAHSVGDGAVHGMIDAYERVNAEFPVAQHRPCITHSNFMSLDAIQKMKALGIVADLQPAWLERDGATLVKQFGYERLKFFQPYKTLEDHGVMVGGGSDHMQKIGSFRSINPYNPFLGMWIMLRRQPRWTEQILHPEQRVSRAQAIRFYTIQNAFLTFEEKEKGSLESGKLADFIVLDRDILTCPEDQVKSIQVLATYLGGKRVHGRL